MLRTLLTAGAVMLLGVGTAASPSHASDRRCEENAAAKAYLSQPVDGITGAALADDFINAEILPKADANIRRFWSEFATSDKDVAVLVAGWSAGADAKKAIVDQKPLIETLRQLRATIIAFEDAREPPEKAAELLAGEWNDWRSRHMSRSEFISQFLSEASARRKSGIPVYGATLQAAQVLRNRLDDLHSGAGPRTEPGDTYDMWLWDSSLRQKAVAAKAAALQAMEKGKSYWNSYFIHRTTTIKCVGADLKSSQAARAAEKAREVIGEIEFPTAGYSNPKFFRAIYDGRTEGMRVSQVGLYLTAFLSMFTNADDDAAGCRTVVSQATLMRIAGAGSADMLKQIFGGLAQAHRNTGAGRDGLFAQGFGAGAGTFGGMALSEASAQADAQLFYDHHGCESAVAKRFFRNLSAFAAQK